MSNFTKHQLFSSGDTLSKMSIHTVEGNQAFIFCQFRHSLPKILKWEQGGISLYGQLTGLSPKDSVDAMRTIHHIPHKNNYSGNRHFNAFGNRFQGWDGNTVLPYELIFLRLELTQTPVSTFSRTYDNPRELFLYPNPAQAYIHLRNAALLESDILNMYNIT